MTTLSLSLYFLAAIVVHEIGHYVVAQIFGIRVKGIRIDRRGIALVRERGAWFDCAMVALAGPAFNLAAAYCLPDNTWWVIANLCVGLVQLVPLQGSDGHHVVECLRRIEAVRDRERVKRNGYVDDGRLRDVLYLLFLHPDQNVHVQVKTQADAERFFERVHHAGADTSRLTVQVLEAA